MKILKKQVNYDDRIYQDLAFEHRHSLLKDEKFKMHREEVIEQLSKLIMQNGN